MRKAIREASRIPGPSRPGQVASALATPNYLLVRLQSTPTNHRAPPA